MFTVEPGVYKALLTASAAATKSTPQWLGEALSRLVATGMTMRANPRT